MLKFHNKNKNLHKTVNGEGKEEEKKIWLREINLTEAKDFWLVEIYAEN